MFARACKPWIWLVSKGSYASWYQSDGCSRSFDGRWYSVPTTLCRQIWFGSQPFTVEQLEECLERRFAYLTKEMRSLVEAFRKVVAPSPLLYPSDVRKLGLHYDSVEAKVVMVENST
ncbi:hypothetical protein FNV43_RR04535 [Rhamnella rubrinervis]|uniref:Uncharacterized protein n=1 Tax=Rhamnella rubrinervis TaxID=2594499 RepID=A0A8K0MQC2_9ROSA|nr:hypothetical protein FNV43_RR04535 [Rhamnella rubrinervis]